jgi:hypothetical protein
MADQTPARSERQVLVEAEMRKVCGRGHTLNWRPWYRSAAPSVLGHCVCGSPYQREVRGPQPLERRGLTAAGDWVAIEFPALADDAERIAAVAVRAYLNGVLA